MGWGQFKPLLAEAAIEALRPIQTKYEEVRSEPGYLDSVLKQGRERASEVANATLRRVQDALGFSRPVA